MKCLLNLNYNVGRIIKELFNCFDYTIMKYLIIASFLLFIVLCINKRISKYIVWIISLIFVLFILFYYHKYLFSVDIFRFFNHNIYFYFMNTIIYLICICVFYKSNKNIIFNVIYCLNFVFIFFSLFMTHYMHNNSLFVLGNIYPMIVIGNYIYFGFYIYIVLYVFLTKRRRVCYNLDVQEVNYEDK